MNDEKIITHQDVIDGLHDRIAELEQEQGEYAASLIEKQQRIAELEEICKAEWKLGVLHGKHMMYRAVIDAANQGIKP
jgi:hypothetical protein